MSLSTSFGCPGSDGSEPPEGDKGLAPNANGVGHEEPEKNETATPPSGIVL